MRTVLFFLIAILLLMPCQGIIHLFSGSDAYGRGLSYPDYKEPLAIEGFVANDHTAQLASVFLGTTIFRPEFAHIKSINRSQYYWVLDPIWYYHNPPMSNSDLSATERAYDIQVPAVREFLKPRWTPASTDYQTSSFQKFMRDDWESPELESENYPGVKKFLGDRDDLLGRPLL